MILPQFDTENSNQNTTPSDENKETMPAAQKQRTKQNFPTPLNGSGS